MKFKYILSIFLITLSMTKLAAEQKVDCLILEDENSIICKYIHQRSIDEKTITVEWIEPNGDITRTREMVIPPNHRSIYDYRYIQGRTKGKWTFKVIDDGDEFTTNFVIE